MERLTYFARAEKRKRKDYQKRIRDRKYYLQETMIADKKTYFQKYYLEKVKIKREKARLRKIELIRQDKNRNIEKTFTKEDLEYISSLPIYENKRKPSDYELSWEHKRKLRLGLQTA